MKKKLLLVAFAIIAMNGFSQKIWNFSAWADSPGVGTGTFPVVIDGLSITGMSTNANMGAVNASAKSFTDANSKTYDFTKRFQFNGAGYPNAAATDMQPVGSNMPTQRYVQFNVSGNAKVYVIGVSGSSSSARKLFVTDGTNLIGSVDFPAATTLNDGTINYTGPATTLYVFGNQAINLYYLSTTNYIPTNVNEINAGKTVQSIQYFDVLGKKINGNAKGLILKKVTYDDGTTATIKEYVKGK